MKQNYRDGNKSLFTVETDTEVKCLVGKAIPMLLGVLKQKPFDS